MTLITLITSYPNVICVIEYSRTRIRYVPISAKRLWGIITAQPNVSGQVGDRINSLPISFKHATSGEIKVTVRRYCNIIIAPTTFFQFIRRFRPCNDTRFPSSSPLRRKMPRQRRKSSGLGAELPGDTGASALSTLEPTPTFNSPPLTPVCTHP